MELIKDKVVIVTGAAAGIGAGVAKLFTEGGAHVFLTDLHGPNVKKVAAALHAEGGSAFGFAANAPWFVIARRPAWGQRGNLAEFR